MALFCVRFKGNPCSVGYLRPWNSVRDGETYSLTYLIPSNIDGIKDELKCKGDIKRHKLRFNGMTEEFIKSPEIHYSQKGKDKLKRKGGISVIHQICNPEIILGFDNPDDANRAATQTLYVGQTQYEIYPTTFEDDNEDKDSLVVELSEDEFDKLRGTETFETDKEHGVYCGNNRYRNNERMYITIKRTK